jgi:serine/threonine-protein kinase
MGADESDGPAGRLDEVPFGAYVLERRIAVGGMSEVFLARPRNGSTPAAHVVIKRLLPELVEDDAVRRTFELEAQLHARVHHKNVVGYYEYGSYAGEPYIALEYVSGVDLSRIMRRAASENRPLTPSMCFHVARELCSGLAVVHATTDERGASLGVVHRDVTPSNVLVSVTGDVKLGDFGIAKISRTGVHQTSLALKGKYAYLAPEQVAGDPFDHRADLFSVAVVLAEMLLGEPLFTGAGQLAVLLAIRDARIDVLRAGRSKLPPGTFELLEKALSRLPDDRFQSANELAAAMKPFAGTSRGAARGELSGWAGYTLDNASAARRLEGAVLEVRALTGAARRRDTTDVDGLPLIHGSAVIDPSPLSQRQPPSQPQSQRKTMPGEAVDCRLRAQGKAPEPLSLTKLIELLATGHVSDKDEIDLGDGFHRIENVEMLARYLPPSTATTKRLTGPGVPDYSGRLPESTVAEALAWIARNEESGVLFVEQGAADRPRTELYFAEGKLVMTSSSEPRTLLGAHLVHKGLIDQTELELALLVMHKYNGQLGDTLIALGLADPMEVFQAIRSQGRERVSQLFRWTSGELHFYRGVEPAKLDFRLDLDIPALVLQGMHDTRTDLEIEFEWATKLHETFAAPQPMPQWARAVTWPAPLIAVLRSVGTPRNAVELIEEFRKGKGADARATKADVLRALETTLLLGVVTHFTGPA